MLHLQCHLQVHSPQVCQVWHLYVLMGVSNLAVIVEVVVLLSMPIRIDVQPIEILHLTNVRRCHNRSRTKFVPKYFVVVHFAAKYYVPVHSYESSTCTISLLKSSQIFCSSNLGYRPIKVW